MLKKDIKTINSVKNVATDVTPENYKKLNKQSKIIVAIVSIALVLALAVGGCYLYEKNANKWDVKQKEITIEYGEVYEPTFADFVDNEKYPGVTSDNTQIKVNADYENDLQDENKPLAYYAVGDYDIDVVHKIEYKLFGATIFSTNDTKKVKLSIKDTIAPVFAEDSPMELETYKDCVIENIEENFKATDKASITISIDKENIDYSTVGEYITNVYAIDVNGNVANKEVKIKVLEPTVELDKSSLNMTLGDTTTITATVKGKEQNVEWSSSDESIAKVDSGNVTAIGAGTVTITAKANGVESTCAISVKTKVQSKTSSNGNKKSSSNNGNTSKNSSRSDNSSSSSKSDSSSTTTTIHDHSGDTGNCGKWFSSYSELDNYYMHWAIKQGGNYSGYYNASQCGCGMWTADFISY